MNETILIIEDDKTILNFIHISLTARQYKCLEAETGRQGLLLATSYHPEVIILDMGLPDLDGMEIIRMIRSFSKVPIIVVTARGLESEKADTLDAGADDYLCKPFSMVELLARIRVALRHAQTNSLKLVEKFIVRDLCIDFEKRKVTLSGNEVHLTPNEYRILALLAQNAGKVLTHNFLAKELWRTPLEKDANSLRVLMTGIRHKIEKDPSRPCYIKTEIGVGYRLLDE